MERFRLAPVLAFAGIVGAVALGAQQGRVTARIDNGQTVVLRGNVRGEANARNDRGAVEGSFRMPDMMLLLKASAAQRAALAQLLARQQDPSSPDYHRWLTPQQYADQFGVSPADISKITDWLVSQGFAVDYVAPSRTWIRFGGTAAQVAGAFGTSIHHYDVGGEMHYANSTDPSIPAALAGVVAGIRGLTDFRLQPRLRKALPQMTTPGGTHHIAPDDLAAIYDIAPLYAAGVDGTGQAIAVVGQSNIQLSDIQAFNTTFNLPAPKVTKILAGHSNPGFISLDENESDLDIEWSGAVARNAQILFYFATDVWSSAMYAIEQDQAKVLTMSYSICEPSDMADLPTFQKIARQANAEGMTFVAASGDSGAAGCEDSGAAVAQNGLAVSAPASVPEVTGVGGTEFQEQGGEWSSTNNANSASALSYIPETAWNDTALAGSLSSTGGGASIFFTQPSWQTGVGVPADGWRHVPDVALAASPAHDSYYVYASGGTAYYGGTSFGAPSWAGIVALLNQYLIGTGIQSQSGLGNINPQLYRLAGAAGVFHDVTSGNNIVPCVAGSPNCVNGSLGYSASPNYDQVTGLGSIDVYNLAHQWSTQAPRNSAVTASIDSNPVFQTGSEWTFTITLSEEAGIATRLTTFTINGLSSLNAFSSPVIPANGSIAANLSLLGLAAPTNVVFVFGGLDASGATWTTQMSIPFKGPQIALNVGGASNAASGQQVFAPGMIMSVYGTALATMAQSAGTIPLPDYMAGFVAQINGVPTPLYYVSPNQVNLQVPYETQTGVATLELSNAYQVFPYQFNVSSAGPGIFMNADGSVNPSRSGSRGQTYFLFITGEGPVTPSLPTGTTPSATTPLARLPKPVQAVTVTIGGVEAPKTFWGIPSGLVGVTQINFTVPAEAPLGAQPLVVTVGTTASQAATFTVTQ